MIDAKKAAWYTAEQRKALCDWCRKQKSEDCKKCGITITDPKAKKRGRK